MRLAPLLLVALFGCATTKPPRERCEDDARAQYQQCLNPTFVPEGEPLPVVTGEQTQDCRGAYHQALMDCGGRGGEIPLVPIGTSSSTPSAN